MTGHLSERRTEEVAVDLLRIQGWRTEAPPSGNLLRQNEYKRFPHLAEMFEGRSKRGPGDAYPDLLLVTVEPPHRPLLVVETKSDIADLEKGLEEATGSYALACRDAGHEVVAAAVAGQEKGQMGVAVAKCVSGTWRRVLYGRDPVSWLPTPDDTHLLLSDRDKLDLAPVVPSPDVLADHADLINRILREAHIRDELRPAHVAAMMLALWKARGNIRKDPDFVLGDINNACARAFRDAGKSKLAESLALDEANQALAESAWLVLSTLEKLNVVTAAFSHDYLGQLYETFFRYTGGNTIGQYFTPRHITRFMADLCQFTPTQTVIDPACGTGGFLIACIQRVADTAAASYEQSVEMVQEKLIGYESEPTTAALCVANMILRGDGTTGVRRDNCFTARDFPRQTCDVALMNPPFPHKKTDVPTPRFVDRALRALHARGLLAVIVEASLLVKGGKLRKWRNSLLGKHSLRAVCQFPGELFQPYASSTTAMLLLEADVPQDASHPTVFVNVRHDGLALKKGIRVRRSDGRDDLPAALSAVARKASEPGFSAAVPISEDMEWAPGAHIPAAPADEADLEGAVDELLRRWLSFYVRYAREIAAQRAAVQIGDLAATDYASLVSATRMRNAEELRAEHGTIGAGYTILYGMKELHSREGIPSGQSLVISPTEEYNGCYGWLHFPQLMEPPFLTVAQTGSIGEAFVQTEPCAVNDDCLVLLPRDKRHARPENLFLAAAAIRLEEWRFNYGRKLTPSRIVGFRLPDLPELEKRVARRFRELRGLAEQAVAYYRA